MTKAREDRKPHQTLRRQVLDWMREKAAPTTQRAICEQFGHMPQKAIKNALAGLRQAGLAAVVGAVSRSKNQNHRGASLWVATPDGAPLFVDTRQGRKSPRDAVADARFAELIGPHRYEDFPVRPEGRLTVASSGGLFSATGCAALMCLT